MNLSVLSDAWRIYQKRFSVIAAVVVAVWLPCEFLSNYLDAFVFGPEDFRKSLEFSRFLDAFFGIIATTGVISIALGGQSGEPVTFGGAIASGFRCWGRMWVARFLSGLMIVAGVLCLVIPGIYLSARLCFVESAVVAEGMSGVDAIRRSFEITRGRFWEAFQWCILIGLAVAGPIIVVAAPVTFVPAIDHWLIHVFSELIVDIIAQFATVAFLCGYQAFIRDGENRVVTAVHPGN